MFKRLTFQNILSLLFLLISGNIIAGGTGSHVFIENRNQWESQVLFKANLSNGAIFLEKNTFTYVLKEKSHHHESDHPHAGAGDAVKFHALKMHFEGASLNPHVVGKQEITTKFNYFIGKNQSKWAGNVPGFSRVRYENLYPGIDLEIYTQGDQLKYDLFVAPGADPAQVKLRFEGADDFVVEAERIIMQTSVGQVIENIPLAYQDGPNGRTVIPCSYAELGNNRVGFSMGNYNANEQLVIDPQLVFSTYSGSFTDNWGFSASYDNAGNGYSGGIVFGAGFPVTPGAYQTNPGIGNLAPIDIGILKYSSDGTQLLYATYLGGEGHEFPTSLMVNDNQELFVLATTGSNNFPVTQDCVQPQFRGGPNSVVIAGALQFPNGSDLAITRFSADGSSLIASTYLGGTSNDGLNNVVPLLFNYADEARGTLFVDQTGNVYIGTSTQSNDFPVTPNAFQSTYGGGNQDGVIIRLGEDLDEIVWASFFGGSGSDAIYSVVENSLGQAVICGGTSSSNLDVTNGAFQSTNQGGSCDGFAAIISADGTAISSCTYVGSNSYDQTYLCDVDEDNNVYVYGQTSNNNNAFLFNATYFNPSGKMFITKLTNDLSARVWSTIFGKGSPTPDIVPTALLVDICQKVYVSGWGAPSIAPGTGTENMTVTPDAFLSTTDGSDFYFMVISENADQLIYATYFGGADQNREHVDGGTSRFDRNGIVYQSVCASCGGVQNFPTTPGAYSSSNNSFNCNNALFKFDFQAPITTSSFNAVTEVDCAPAIVTFTNNSNNAIGYEWLVNGEVITSTEDLTITLEEPGFYTIQLVATDQNSCNLRDTSTQVVEVRSPGTRVEKPDLAVCRGIEVIIGDTLFDPENFNFTWQPATGLADPTAQQTSFIAEEEVTYTLLAAFGSCIDTIVQRFTIFEDSLQVGTPAEVCFGTSIDLVASGNDADYIYSWNPIIGVSNPNTAQTSAIVNETTLFFVERVLRDSSLFCPLRDSVLITVVGSPERDTLPDVSACLGLSVEIGPASLEAPFDSFQWLTGPGIGNPDVLQQNIILSETFEYGLEITWQACKDTLFQRAIADFIPINELPDITVCVGSNIILANDAPSVFFNYAWEPSVNVFNPQEANGQTIADSSRIFIRIRRNNATPLACPEVDTVRTFVIGSLVDSLPSVSLCLNGSAQIGPGNGSYPGTDFAWSPFESLSDPFSLEPIASPEEGTLYTLIISLPECKDTIYQRVIVLQDTFNIGGDKVICPGETVQLGYNDNSGFYTYEWSPAAGLNDATLSNPTLLNPVEGVYVVSRFAIIEGIECVSVDSVTVSFFISEPADTLGGLSVCANVDIEIGPLQEFPPGTTFSWSPAESLANESSQNPLFNDDQSQFLTLIATSVAGCIDTIRQFVLIRSDEFSAGDDIQVCPEIPGLIGNPNLSNDYIYAWTPSGLISPENSPVANITTAENVTVTLNRIPVEGNDGCPGFDTVQVSLIDPPILDIQVGFNPGCDNMALEITNEGEENIPFVWQTNGNEIFTSPILSLTLNYGDSVFVALIGTKGACRDTADSLVKVLPLSAYYKESDVNAFSPNGDGKNDCFSPALQLAPEPLDKAFVECTDLFVYNRWGELVFDSVVKGNACWNGTKMNGDDLPEGVYFYRYRYNGEERAGAVHLRRL